MAVVGALLLTRQPLRYRGGGNAAAKGAIDTQMIAVVPFHAQCIGYSLNRPGATPLLRRPGRAPRLSHQPGPSLPSQCVALPAMLHGETRPFRRAKTSVGDQNLGKCTPVGGRRFCRMHSRAHSAAAPLTSPAQNAFHGITKLVLSALLVEQAATPVLAHREPPTTHHDRSDHVDSSPEPPRSP